jgi:hypothetical protein
MRLLHATERKLEGGIGYSHHLLLRIHNPKLGFGCLFLALVCLLPQLDHLLRQNLGVLLGCTENGESSVR